MTAAEDLAVGLLAGIGQADPDLAVALDGPDLRAVCAQLAHLLWTPLMLERLGSHPRWAQLSPDDALAELRGLGLPPEAPRSAVPARQDLCLEHQQLMHAGVCDWCKAGAADVDHRAGAAAARAAIRPTPATGIDLIAPEGANA